MGGRTIALRTGLLIVRSGNNVLRESSGVALVLINAVSDGVWIGVSAGRVLCRWSTFSWIGMAVASKPVRAKHLIWPSPLKVGPVAWWKKEDLMLLSNGSRVKMTMDGIDWIEARLASLSAREVEVSKMLIKFEHSVCSWMLSSWNKMKSAQLGSSILIFVEC